MLYYHLLFNTYGSQLKRLRDIEIAYVKRREDAKARDAYGRWDTQTGESSALGGRHATGVKQEIKDLQMEEVRLRTQLPGYIQALSGNGYALRVFYFEIVECLRKLAIIGVPVWFQAGSTQQALFAVLITFMTFGLYSTILPYAAQEDNHLALASQFVIFFTISSAITLQGSTPVFLDVMLTTLFILLNTFAILLSTPGFVDIAYGGGLAHWFHGLAFWRKMKGFLGGQYWHRRVVPANGASTRTGPDDPDSLSGDQARRTPRHARIESPRD